MSMRRGDCAFCGSFMIEAHEAPICPSCGNPEAALSPWPADAREHSSPLPRERPILFSAPMVRALLAGTKTQTRRVLKAPGAEDFSGVHNANMGGVGGGIWWDGWFTSTNKINRFRCPYGVPGDVLWVRESFTSVDRGSRAAPRLEPMWAADWEGFDKPDRDWDWRPSIHMPRWASRISLRITDVRVERLNKISHEDCWAEGVVCDIHGARKHTACSGLTRGYQKVWEAINGPGSWAANPWVWAVSFERIAA